MISLIVCTYNREKYIGEMLAAIAACQYPSERYEIVLVDNNSNDNTASICKKFQDAHPEAPYRYCLEARQGLSHARNRGIKEAQGDIIVFLDDDAFVDTDYLQNLEKNLAQYPDAAAFGGRIDPLFESGTPPEWLCKWTMSWVSAIDKGDRVILFNDKYPIGANMGFRRQTLEQCGSFSTKLGRSGKNLMGGEEKDIFLRVRRAGLNIYYFPDVRVRHIIPAHRTTREYVVKFGEGIGMSEQLRCSNEGGSALFKRWISEIIKWGATFLLWFVYLFKGHPVCGNYLVLFRWHVTRGLLKSIPS